MMLDKKNLSKLKFIYRLFYDSTDKKLHCEKYPVIYINSKVVYYKNVRKGETLGVIDLTMLQDISISEWYERKGDTIVTNINFYALYFSDAGNNCKQILEKLNAGLTEKNKLREKKMAEEALQKKYREYEKALVAYEEKYGKFKG